MPAYSLHEQVIRANLSELCKLTVLTKRILDQCVTRGIITSDVRGRVKSQGDLDEYDAKSYFYETVMSTRDPNMYAEFVKISEEEETLQTEGCLKILRQGLDPYGNFVYLPDFNFKKIITLNDGTTFKEMDWVSTLKVANPDQIPSFPRYEVRPGARFALVVNITTFVDQKDRSGAQYDSIALATVLSKYGYKVSEIEGRITAENLLTKMSLFKKMCKDGDACVVAIMSHGERDVIITSEGVRLSINKHILAEFNNTNFSDFVGKPKIFFFQACRGHERDLGAAMTERDGQTFTKWNNDVLRKAELKIPTWTDMMICYATLEGQYSYRESNGSWFIQVLCEKLDAYGEKMDLSKILLMVAEQMKEETGSGGEKQICPWTNIGFTKEFYF